MVTYILRKISTVIHYLESSYSRIISILKKILKKQGIYIYHQMLHSSMRVYMLMDPLYQSIRMEKYSKKISHIVQILSKINLHSTVQYFQKILLDEQHCDDEDLSEVNIFYQEILKVQIFMKRFCMISITSDVEINDVTKIQAENVLFQNHL